MRLSTLTVQVNVAAAGMVLMLGYLGRRSAYIPLLRVTWSTNRGTSTYVIATRSANRGEDSSHSCTQKSNLQPWHWKSQS